MLPGARPVGSVDWSFSLESLLLAGSRSWMQDAQIARELLREIVIATGDSDPFKNASDNTSYRAPDDDQRIASNRESAP
jgi:hypothetical protein